MPESNSIFVNVWRCFLSPKLFRIYNLRNSNGYYEPNTLENWGDKIIQASIVLWHVTCYAFPVIVYQAYKRNFLSTTEWQIFWLKVGAVGAIAICSSFVLRALGRATNATYLEFNEKYRSIIRNYNNETKKQLQNYEFDYTAWPVDFDLKSDKYKGKVSIACSEGTFSKALSSPSSLVGYAALHSFAIKMIYPGSISILNLIIRNNLSIGRKKLIEEKHAERFKLATPDNNELDVIFVDQRNKTALGSTLVICTEGNAGFYEMGIMVTPLDLGYSVLGWNHPGFGWSTGTPYIYEEKCAIETVLQFAFQRLNFIPENVILFGWSIGGFASSYAATIYPDIRAVILDATFDDILPLAVKQMPKFLEPIVSVSIRDHANLDVASHLTQYCGPIVLVRRSEDEIISLTEGDISTNRGNYLLLRILKSRYPQLFTNETEAALWAWFGVTGQKKVLIYDKFKVDLDACKSEYDAHKIEIGRQYPSSLGKDFDVQKKTQMLLYLASLYMVDFPSNHCTSLPSDMFNSFSQI